MEYKVYLKRKEEKRIKSGHLWIFSNEIFIIDGEPSNGDIVEIYDSNKTFIASAFYNKNSLISCRILSYSKIDDITEVLRQNILSAYNLRKLFYPKRQSFRLAFSESDYLPGLIIDKYEDTYVLQVYSAGMERNLDSIAEILRDEFAAKNIFTKNETGFRNLENLPAEDRVLYGKRDKIKIEECGIIYEIDFENSQKTGFYFDQTDNRIFIEKLSGGRTILDAFCNQGGFGLHAFKAGAEKVDFLDSSDIALKAVENNCILNNFDLSKANFYNADVFDFLENASLNKTKYDIVMIDPPAFAKNKKSIATAKKGYEKLNRLAMLTVNPGGLLVTSSCSHHLTEEDFFEVLNNASVKAGKKIQLLHFNNASMDHPELLSMKETVYLKFAVLRVL
jgi:23S rRNA (cytosine1962-C5)-methyltransferase